MSVFRGKKENAQESRFYAEILKKVYFNFFSFAIFSVFFDKKCKSNTFSFLKCNSFELFDHHLSRVYAWPGHHEPLYDHGFF